MKLYKKGDRMISIICVYNNETSLKNQLMKSLNQFNTKDFELILLDSAMYGFTCSADGLNYGAEKANGDVLIFTHQDIFIKDEREFYDFCNFIEKSSTGTIIGAAGSIEGNKENYTNYTTGSELDTSSVNRVDGIREVACIDESFFGMKKETFISHPFDNKLCDNWHLYAVEISLFARKKGKKVFVYPIQIHHYSNGKISIGYMKGLLKIADRYKDSFSYIWTCCYKVRTSWIYTRGLYAIWCAHRVVMRRPLR